MAADETAVARGDAGDVKAREQLRDLLMEVEQGKTDQAALERLFEEVPGLWRRADLANAVALRAIDEGGESAGTRALARANYRGLKRELGYEQAGPLERTVIEHVALCWLRLLQVERGYTQAMVRGGPIREGDYWERRLSAAQRRYLRACETLARIRKLGLPTVQVNIGEKQVNVAR